MALDKPSVPGRPAIWIIVGQGPPALAVRTGGVGLDSFTLIYHFTPLPPSLWVGWLVGCFKFNGPLRQYFSLYRAVSQRDEKEERNDRQEKKCPNNPHPHLLQAQ